ncbi:hypothetical protein GCM10010406_11130 [Streptomyces thermolineatus]|uniref:Uncharacterized protein n=1 Tax=Streptomyces thermolineatus TaxID=44033 RepID=A0ABP5YC46_9ACTN
MVNSGRERQAMALREAALRKAKKCREAAEKGLREVQSSGNPVTFASVARAAGVSTKYLRGQKDLAFIITTCRQAGSTAEDSIISKILSTKDREFIGVELLPSNFEELSSLVRHLEVLLQAAKTRLEKISHNPSGAQLPAQRDQVD